MAGGGERGILNVSRRAGRGKIDHPGDHIIVSRKRIVTGKEKLREKNRYRKGRSPPVEEEEEEIISEGDVCSRRNIWRELFGLGRTDNRIPFLLIKGRF